MKSKWMFGSTFAIAVLSAAQASAAVVAVMPVQGVNLTEGQCDAIGVLFANAFARETHVAVASPLESKAVLAQTQSGMAAANKLGAREYVELRAVQLGTRITLAGIRRAANGQEVFRSETAASGMDDMELATASLASSLAWRRPMVTPIAAEMPPEMVAPAALPKGYPKALGIKTGLIFPLGSGKSYATMVSFQFDGRVGTRDSFVEFGAGLAIPASSSSGADQIQMGGVFVELGGNFYLSDGPVAPYLGGGVSPRIWILSAPGNINASGATCTVHGQAGVTFTRDSRARVYGEVRVAQYIIGMRTQDSSGYTIIPGDTYYPTEFSFQLGVGW